MKKRFRNAEGPQGEDGPHVNTERRVVHVIDGCDVEAERRMGQLRRLGYEPKRYPSAEQFLGTYVPAAYECLLVEILLPLMSGLDLQQALSQQGISAPVLMTSASAETADVVTAMRQGAVDFLEKGASEFELGEKVAHAMAIDFEAKRLHRDLYERMHRLSAREREVMDHLLTAATTVRIARRLGICPKTVEKHRVRIFDKMQVSSVPELMRLVWRTDGGEPKGPLPK